MPELAQPAMGDNGINDNNDNNHLQVLISDSEMGEGAGFQGFCEWVGKRSIAERRGFSSDAARINTARFRTTSPLASPAARSPCLTIPPGISPTALLDSPVMLPNSQVLSLFLFILLHASYHLGLSASLISECLV